MTDEKTEPLPQPQPVRPGGPSQEKPLGGEAATGRVRGTHSPARGESKDRGVAERGETK